MAIPGCANLRRRAAGANRSWRRRDPPKRRLPCEPTPKSLQNVPTQPISFQCILTVPRSSFTVVAAPPNKAQNHREERMIGSLSRRRFLTASAGLVVLGSVAGLRGTAAPEEEGQLQGRLRPD